MRTPAVHDPDPDLRAFIKAVILPALLERFLSQHRSPAPIEGDTPAPSRIQSQPSG